MVRNLLCFSRSCVQIALLVGFGISSRHGWALGLGEIELSSALNEKLNARVELIEAVGMLPTEILVTLASREDFERVGVERFFYLTSLQFEVVLQGNRAWINVTSRKPIAEPYLNFLVQVHWPMGGCSRSTRCYWIHPPMARPRRPVCPHRSRKLRWARQPVGLSALQRRKRHQPPARRARKSTWHPEPQSERPCRQAKASSA